MVAWSSLGDHTVTVIAVSATAAVVAAAVLWSRLDRREWELVGEVSGLYSYPIKSCKGIANQEAVCTNSGLQVSKALDRHFVIVRANGDFITQRQIAKMAGVTTSTSGDDLVLDAPGKPQIKVPLFPKLDRSKLVQCRVWTSSLEAQDCGDGVGRWLSEYLQEEGLKLLVLVPGLTLRDSRCVKAKSKDKVGFPDRAPYLIATEESLADLNSRVGQSLDGEVTMMNFRPTIVIKGVKKPWDEDTWAELKIGKDVRLRVLEPCGRCILTTVDPEKLEKREDGEPLKTLRRFRLFPDVNATAPLFAVYAGLDKGGRIKIGDPVYAVRGDGLAVKISPGV